MSAVARARPTYAQASRALLRDSVLDAVGELLASRPWSDVTMADAAARAGVSRQSIYNAFGGREELAQAYLLREGERFITAIEGGIRANVEDPRAALRSALALFLSLVATHPIVRSISSGADNELAAMATTRSGGLVSTITRRLAALLIENWAERLSPGDAALIAETVVRLAISHAAQPSGTPERTAEDLSRLLGPFIDELLAG